ncbi:MAG: hypothetical protein KGL29_09410 [Alphaproteobacteria bacterium]|nr:hypothetical protein [Alphaproteobacteria bacterium]MDE2161565.1 hypothetical protein [Alphaproteobacteria bacterium]MDE2266103.1 hypothetical protein [Alphaproteobacteria bacterium]MDE2498802.1 hypothetical protein [Alphaproteobacteria bacterium]
MSLSPQEAASTLSDVERAARRSGQAYGYRKASPHLIVWGLIWVVGYATTDLRMEYANIVWPVLTVLGVALSTYVGRCESIQGGGRYRSSWRVLGLVALAIIFIGATYSIMGHVSGPQQGAFIPLLVGTVYAGMGLWLGPRFLVTGLAVIVLTLGGYFYLQEHFLLWQAVVGGGALILAGLWLRTV